MESLTKALASIDLKRVTRASKSLIFKLKNGLVEEIASSVGRILSTIEDQIGKLVKTERFRDHDALEALCELIVCLIEADLLARGDPRLGSTLQALMMIKEANSNIAQRSQVFQAIQLISSIAVSHPNDLELTEHHDEAVDVVLENAWIYTASAPQPSQRLHRSTRGAGAILYSSLLQYGWRFPEIKLSEADEKYLFDLEVKLKLKHEHALATFLDALSDFPAFLLSQRVGLLHFLLDLAGAPFSFADFEQKPNGYHAYFALTSLHELFVKVLLEKNVLRDGGMVTVTHNSRESVSDAVEQAASIHQYRYPSSISNDQTPATSSGLLPPPTLSGLAFALVAAVMPLLISTDSKLVTLAAKVFHICMPQVIEQDLSLGKLSSENCSRLRYLLSRFEQLLTNAHFSDLFKQFWTVLRSNVDKEDAPSSAERTQIVEELSSMGVSFVLLDCLLRCLSCLQPEWMQSEAQESNPHLLQIGPNTLRLMIAWISSPNLMQSLFSATLTTTIPSVYMRLDTILAKIDPSSSLHAHISAEHAENIATFLQLTKVQLSEDYFLAGPAALQHLQDVVQRAEKTATFLLTHQDDPINASLQLLEVDILAYSIQATDIFQIQNEEEDQAIIVLQSKIANFLAITLSLGSIEHIHRLLNERVVALISSTLIYRTRLCNDFMVSVICERIVKVESREASSELTLKLLQMLLMIVNTSFDYEKHNLAHLRDSIPRISVILWQLKSETSRFRQEHAQLEKALQRLEQQLNTDEDDSNIFLKCLVMGLFHHQQDVRVESAIKLRRHVLSEQSSLFSLDADSSVPSILQGKYNDPFSPSSFLVLKNIEGSNVVNPTGVNIPAVAQSKSRRKVDKDYAKKRVFSHQDMQELCNIGFGDHLDIAVQLSALLQLQQMMTDDIELIRTADERWLLQEVLSKAMNLVEDMILITTANQSAHRLDVDRLQKLRRIDCEYALACIMLVRLVCLHCPQMLSHVNLKLFILLILSSNESLDKMSNTICEGSKLIKQLAYLSAELLHFYTLSAHSWLVRDPYDRIALQYILHDGSHWSKNVSLKAYPINLVRSFGSPDVVSDQKTLIYSELESTGALISTPMNLNGACGNEPLIVQLRLQLNKLYANEEEEPPIMLVRHAWDDLKAPPTNSLQMAIVTTCFDLLVAAENHRQVFDSCCLFQCLAVVFGTALDRMFVALNIDLVTAVSKIVTTLPRTKKDHFTFFHILQFLNEHLRRLMQIHEQEPMPNVHRVMISIVELCLPTIANLLLTSQSSDRQSNKANVATVEICKAIEIEFYDLLLVVTGFATDEWAIGAILTDQNLLRFIVFDRLFLSSEDNRTRAKSVAIIINLLKFHQGAVLLRSLESCDGNSAAYFAPLQRLIRIAKLLRSPDSFQEHSLTVLSLQAIHTFIVGEINEHTMQLEQIRDAEFWSWLVRLLYDRRAEVRLLSLEVIRTLLPYSNVDELRSSSPPFESKDSEQEEEEQFRSLFSWPPLEQIYHLAMDSYECAEVKAKCLLITMQYIDLYQGQNDAWIVPFPLVRFAECMHQLLLIEESHSSTRALLDVMEVFILLFKSSRRNVKYLSDFVTLFRSMKTFPKIVSLLDKNDVSRQRFTAEYRRFFTPFIDKNDRESVNYYNNEQLITLSSNVVQSQDQAEDWYREQISFILLSEAVLRFIVLLSLEQTPLFEEIFLRSKFIQFLTFSISTLFQAELRSNFHLHNQRQLSLEVLLLTRFLDVQIFAITQPDAKSTYLNLLYTEQGLKMIETSIESIAKALSNLFLIGEQDLHNDHIMQVFLTKAMQIVALTTNDVKFVRHLRLVQNSTSSYSPYYTFFQELIILRRNLLEQSSSSLCSYVMQMDIVIALLLYRSPACRNIYRSILGFESDREENIRFIRYYIRAVTVAADETKAVPSTDLTSSTTKVGGRKRGGISNDENSANSSNASTVPFLLQSKSKPSSSTMIVNKRSNGKVNVSVGSSNSNNRWREKTRSYSWRQQSSDDNQSSASHHRGLFQLSDTTLQSLWISCLLLNQTLRLSADLFEMDVTQQFCVSLLTLLKFFAQHSLLSSLPSTVSLSDALTDDLHIKLKQQQQWYAGKAAASVGTLLMSFLDGHYHPLTTLFLRHSEEVGRTVYLVSKAPAGSQEQGQQGITTLLHFFVSLGVNHGVVPATRRLCLSIIPGLLNSSSSSQFTPTVKVSLSHVLAVNLQRVLRSSPVDSEAVFYLLLALAAFLTPDRSGVSCYTQFTSDRDVSHLQISPLLFGNVNHKERAEIVLKEKELTIMPFPALILWIRERCVNDSNILCLLCKCIGRLIDVTGGSGNSFVTTEIISFLAESLLWRNVKVDPLLVTTAAKALRLVLLQSERAKAILRQSAAMWPAPSLTARLQQLIESVDENTEDDLIKSVLAINDILSM